MPAVLADLCIEARWIVPMSMPGRLLENHALVVRDGRILDLCPRAEAAQRYASTALVQRPLHLLMPGMINASAHAAAALLQGAALRMPADERRPPAPQVVRDGVLLAIAELLCSGVTCFADRGDFPDAVARAAGEQGMRAVIGMPVAETSGPWASLNVRDEYKGHPLISTVFAPHAPNALSDATFARIATLADELDAGIMIDLHQSESEIAASIARYGMRPIERLWQLGLLTPALNAIHMALATAEDAALAQRTGISITLCPQSSLKKAGAVPPAAAFAAAGIRVGLGSGDGMPYQSLDLWGGMTMLAQMPCAGYASLSAWDALAMATRGGAAALGLDADVGTLEPGKWADLCCVDLGGPGIQPLGDPITQLVFCGGRDIVSDVWVAGRQLLSDSELTRLDWRGAAQRAGARATQLNIGK
jgi:5-methylthioadenosine/S-adenosylhomocysteine deaminase